MQSLKQAFEDFLNWSSPSNNSRKAGSYIQALIYMKDQLEEQIALHGFGPDLYALSARELSVLREYVLAQQKMPHGGDFASFESPSYWQRNFCSAAITALIRFTEYRDREARILKKVGQGIKPSEVVKMLQEEPLAEEVSLKKVIAKLSEQEGVDVFREQRTRQNQYVFRRMILAIYDYRCCLTGIPVETVLRASHILPWAEDKAERMNPTNGLCLSATYDAAFDRHFISFDDDYRMVLAPALEKYVGNQAYEEAFVSLKGRQLVLPKMEQYAPSVRFLRQHRRLLVAE